MFNPYIRHDLGSHVDLGDIKTGRELVTILRMYALKNTPMALWNSSLFFGCFNLITIAGCVYFLAYVRPGRYWLFRLVESDVPTPRRAKVAVVTNVDGDDVATSQISTARTTTTTMTTLQGGDSSYTFRRIRSPDRASGDGSGSRKRAGRYLVASAVSTQLTFFSIWLLLDIARRIVIFLQRGVDVFVPIVTFPLEVIANSVATNAFYWELISYAHVFLSNVRPLYWNIGVLILPIADILAPCYFVIRASIYEYKVQGLYWEITNAVFANGLDNPWPSELVPKLVESQDVVNEAYYNIGIAVSFRVISAFFLVIGFVVVAYLIITRVMSELVGRRRKGVRGSALVSTAEDAAATTTWISAGVEMSTDAEAAAGFAAPSPSTRATDDSKGKPTTSRPMRRFVRSHLRLPEKELKRVMLYCLISASLGVSLPLVLSATLIPIVLHCYEYTLYKPSRLAHLYTVYAISYSISVFLISTLGMLNLYRLYHKRRGAVEQFFPLHHGTDSGATGGGSGYVANLQVPGPSSIRIDESRWIEDSTAPLGTIEVFSKAAGGKNNSLSSNESCATDWPPSSATPRRFPEATAVSINMHPTSPPSCQPGLISTFSPSSNKPSSHQQLILDSLVNSRSLPLRDYFTFDASSPSSQLRRRAGATAQESATRGPNDYPPHPHPPASSTSILPLSKKKRWWTPSAQP